MEVIVVFFIGLQLASGCYLQFKNTSVPRYFYGRRYKSIVESCTITCSNVYSLSEIFYDYEDHDYQQYLNITESNVTVLHSQDFSKFETIVKLYLTDIHIEEIQSGAFTGLTRLKELHLGNNHLRLLSNGLLDSLTRLEVLDLSNNNLSRIEAKAFSRLSNLQYLELQQNRLTTLENNLFDNLKVLEFLDVSGNPLSKLRFGNIPSVTTLNVAHTFLSEVETDFFTSNSSINVLNMSSNSLKTLDCNRLPESAFLDLSYNKLVNLQNVSHLRSRTLLLKNNHLKSIEGFIHVLNLDLSNNDIEEVNKSLVGKDLRNLDVSFNNIALLNNDSFEDSSVLMRLYLHHNKITEIPRNLFQNTTELKVLDLSFNLIEDFQYGTFNNLPHLLIFNVSHNRLQILPQYVFSALSSLQTLRFDFNNISTLHTKDLTDHIPSLKSVSLNGNIWECNQLIQIYHDLKSANVGMDEGSVFDLDNFKGIVCHKNETSKLNEAIVSDKLLHEIQKMVNKTFGNLVEDFLNKENSLALINNVQDRSDFVKFLNDSKEDLKQMRLRQDVGGTVAKEGGSGGLLVLNVVLQIIMCCLMVMILFIIFRFLRKKRSNANLSLLENAD